MPIGDRLRHRKDKLPKPTPEQDEEGTEPWGISEDENRIPERLRPAFRLYRERFPYDPDREAGQRGT